jgi:hypothetical protein
MRIVFWCQDCKSPSLAAETYVGYGGGFFAVVQFLTAQEL